MKRTTPDHRLDALIDMAPDHTSVVIYRNVGGSDAVRFAVSIERDSLGLGASTKLRRGLGPTLDKAIQACIDGEWTADDKEDE